MASSNSPCAACKFLRRKCTQECDFAPYFSPDNPQRFAHVHRVFGASNVAKLLKELNPADREDAVKSLAYEAEYRLKDPIYGCVGFISALQHRLREIQHELNAAKKELSNYNFNPQTMQFLLANPGTVNLMPQQQQQWNNNLQFAGFPNCPNNFQQQQQHQQEHELLEAQQLAAAAQQEYLLRLGAGVAVSGHADVAHSLGMGNFDNGGSGGGGDGGAGGSSYYQGGGGEQNNYENVGVAHAHVQPIETQVLFSQQKNETVEDGRSVGSNHHSY